MNYNTWMIKLTLGLVLLIITQSAIFPPVKFSTINQGQGLLVSNFCNMQFDNNVNFAENFYYNIILKRLTQQQNCQIIKPLLRQQQQLIISVRYNCQVKSQGYNIDINRYHIELEVSDYRGYVYGLQTLYQILNDHILEQGTINDQPLLQYRGIMIDTSRHFIPISRLENIIKGMTISRLNYLHLHLNDNQAFSFEILSHPQISKYGAYSSRQIYTRQDLIGLQKYASKYGVQIIPEINTPGHARSFGLSPNWKQKDIVIQCQTGKGKYNQQLDISKKDTYYLVTDIIKEVDNLFVDSKYLHLGGYDMSEDCWTLRPSIKNYMLIHNLKSYKQLQQFWRYQLKQIIPKSRKTIYWIDQYNVVNTTADDVVQYVGKQQLQYNVLSAVKGKIILSPKDLAVLSNGRGDVLQKTPPQGDDFIVWKDLYMKFKVFPLGIDRSRIIGGQALVWTQNINSDEIQNIIFMRAAVLASKLWNQTQLSILQLVKSMVNLQKQLYRNGIAASPITNEFCEFNAQKCF